MGRSQLYVVGWNAVALLLVENSFAETVYFTAEVTEVVTFGEDVPISQYIAQGDTFFGSIEYNPNVAGTPGEPIDNIGTWFLYNDIPFTAFSLTFGSGNSAGFSIEDFVPTSSTWQIRDDVLNGAQITDITSGVIDLEKEEFRPGLRQHNFVFRSWDFDAAMVDSAAFTDWNPNRHLPNVDTQINELAFTSVETGFGQRANFNFTQFSSTPPATGSEFIWDITSTGNWRTDNWNVDGYPDGNSHSAIFGNAIDVPSTVVVDEGVSVNSVVFDSPLAYNIAGLGIVSLQGDLGQANIEVLQGNHEIQARVALGADARLDVESESIFTLNNSLDLGGHTLTKEGGGTLVINNTATLGGGRIELNGGTIAGNGRISGALVVNGGIVSPGSSYGTISIQESYTQSSNGVLNLEVGGLDAGTLHDQIEVHGDASLDGTVNLVFQDGFAPKQGDSIALLRVDGVLDTSGVHIELQNIAPGFLYESALDDNLFKLTAVNDAVFQLNGDFDGNETVDGADFLEWQRQYGDADRLSDWESGFRASLAGSTTTDIPEPYGAVLLVAALLFVVQYRFLTRCTHCIEDAG